MSTSVPAAEPRSLLLRYRRCYLVTQQQVHFLVSADKGLQGTTSEDWHLSLGSEVCPMEHDGEGGCLHAASFQGQRPPPGDSASELSSF